MLQLIAFYYKYKDSKIVLSMKNDTVEYFAQTLRRSPDIPVKMLCPFAAYLGRLDILYNLHEKDYTWDKLTITGALANDNLYCLQYAIANNCEMPDKIVEYAIIGQSVECCRYLILEGYPWDKENCLMLAKGSGKKMKKFIQSIIEVDNFFV